MKEIRSDNGINFVGAEREIRESLHRMNYRKLENDLMQRGCKWVFHPPEHPIFLPMWLTRKTSSAKKGGGKHNYWPITTGDAGLKSTYQTF